MSELFDWACEECGKAKWDEIVLGRTLCYQCSDRICPTLCDWPGCIEPINCCSGNVNGAGVCKKHFHITNGLPAEEQEPFMHQMMAMAQLEETRQAFNL